MKQTIFLFFFLFLCSPLFGKGGGDKNASESSKAETIRWISISEAEKLMKTKPKLILVDIYAQWCGWCKRLDKDTFQHPDIAEYINDNFYAVKLDAEMRESVSFLGREYRYLTAGGRGTHELAITLSNGQLEMPTLIILGKGFEQMGIIPGYQDPQGMDAILHYFSDGSYDKDVPWGMYQKRFKSAIKK